MERWQMNRLGFVNFWLYDTDEFPLKDGKLLLRGTNGSGKSITTQSFIPFILDGDKHPSRLDPFGSKDRKMSWYLLGDSENGKDESTAYLYLEFIKPESKQYRTIGIGMHAKKGGNMKTWGFCLKDGRRVGIDFQLYSSVGGKNIPYDTVKLKKQLSEDSRNIFVDKTSDYKEMVAQHIFGIKKEQINDFDQLTNILIKTRSSKLSKDNLKPAQLYAILNDSLQILSDDDLQPMADTMSKLEDSHNKIEDAKKALEEVSRISAEYDRYNRYIFSEKAQRYLDKSCEVMQADNNLRKTEECIKLAQQEKLAATERYEQCETEISDLERERDSLDIKDFQEQLTRKKDSEKRLQDFKQDFQSKQEQITAARESLGEYYRNAAERQTEIDDYNYEKDKLISEFTDYEEYKFPLHESYLHEINFNKNFSDRTDACRNEKKKLSADLKNTLTKINEFENKRNIRETKALLVDEHKQNLKKAENEHDTALAELDRQKDRIIEEFYKASHENTEFIIDETLLKRIENSVTDYEGQGSANTINDILVNQRDTLYPKLMDLLLKSEIDKNEKKKEYDNLCLQLEELKNTSEPHPERTAERLESRNLLEKNNISYRAFYECIDFNETLSEQERSFIESELSDMGLLDALVIPESQLDKALKLIEKFSDSYIITNNELPDCKNDLFTVTASDEFKAVTEKIITLFSKQVSVGKDGFYRNGILAGHSSGTEKAKFVGAENRKAYRLKQIEILSEQIKTALLEYNNSEDGYMRVQERLKKFNLEYGNRPQFSDLNTALDMTYTSENNLRIINKLYDDAVSEFDKAENEFNTAKSEMSIACTKYPYEKTAEAYNEVISAVEDYYNIIYSVIDILKQIKYSDMMLENAKERIYEQEDLLDKYDFELKRISVNIHENEEIIRLCDEFLNRKDVSEKVKRSQEISASLDKLRDESKSCIRLISKYESEIENNKNNLSKLKSELETLVSDETILCSYFKEELDLGFFPEYSNINLKESAQQALKLSTTDDDKKSLIEMDERLRKSYNMNNTALSASYNSNLESCFSDSLLRSRIIITFSWMGKTLPPHIFKSELAKTIEQDMLLIKKNEEEMFKNVLLKTISKKLYSKINESRKWVDEMSELMKSINTSMGLTFSLSWKPRKDISENEMQFDELQKLLVRDEALINAEDYEKLTAHFRSKIEHERLIAEQQGLDVNYTELVKNVMDFRNWFEFKMQFKESGHSKTKELTTGRFNTFSGGERALSLYIPLFAAVAAQYKKAGESAPKIIALDEAFAGVDDSNISEMFGLLEKLGFGYIVNSQALWGCYETVPALEIAELFHEKDSDMITVIYYEWNGKKKLLDDNFQEVKN